MAKINKKLSEYQKMFLAFQRATSELERSIAPDPFKYCDYDYKLEETLQELVLHLKEQEYRSKRVENFNLPKGEFAIRPGIIVDILDLTIINRLLVDFIFKLDEKFPSGVTAYRLRKDDKLQFKIDREHTYFVLPRYKRIKIQIDEPWYNLWPLYIKKVLADLRSGTYKFVAKTDITAYFEDINLLTLGERLKCKVGKHLNSINMLMEIYQSWALRDPGNIRQGRGLPQGSSNISGILSNYYLDTIDSFLERERKKGKIEWYRYCDDFHILCKSKGRAKNILLQIGNLLRKLGLNQNAEKTKLLTADDGEKEINNEIVNKIHSIIEESQKKGADKKRKNLVEELRHEYKKISSKQVFTKKSETSLFIAYHAAGVLNTSLLRSRVGRDFDRFPSRAKAVCNYARRFINYLPVLKPMKTYLHQNTFLYHLQLAFLVTVFRNLRKKDKSIFRGVLRVAFDRMKHWYVRVQAISTLSYLGVSCITESQIKKLLDSKNHRYIRRAAITLIPLSCSPERIKSWLNEMARDLNITISRMANFNLSLITSKNFALNQIKKFGSPHYVFLGDQIWRLWFIALNEDADVKKSLCALLKRIDKEFYNYPIIKEHTKAIRNLASL